jgi:transcriptional regulator with XRE-family HTH domain
VTRRAAAGVGAVIRAARIKANFSQEKLARFTGMKQSVLSRIESGDRHCQLFELEDIARAMGLDPVELFRRILT